MPKITRAEPDGPLRTGLKSLDTALGAENGGDVFKHAAELANGGLDLVLELENRHRAGDSDISIPRTFHGVDVKRKRGEFQQGQNGSQQTELIARL